MLVGGVVRVSQAPNSAEKREQNSLQKWETCSNVLNAHTFYTILEVRRRGRPLFRGSTSEKVSTYKIRKS